MTTWEPAGPEHGADLVRCLRHGEVFNPKAKQRCALCVTDPAPTVVEVEPDVPEAAPKGCRTTLELEATLVELGDNIVGQAKKLTRGKGRINYATAARLYDVAIKAYRAAGEYATSRERRRRVARLEQRVAELRRGRRGSN